MTLTFVPNANFIIEREYTKGVQLGAYANWVLLSTSNPFVARVTIGSSWQELRWTYNNNFLAVQSGHWRIGDTVLACETRHSSNPGVWTNANAQVNYAIPPDKKCRYVATHTSATTKVFRINLTPLPSNWWVLLNPDCAEQLT
jgi:hypothetical protein